MVVESWPGFWLFVLVSGALGGVFLWWLGGWWFALRVRWSGVAAPDRKLARLVMAYSAFVHAAPSVLAAAISSAVFASYAEAFDAEESYSLVLLVFPFWSAVASHAGVREVFGVSGWKLILPCVFYLVAVGAFAALFAYLESEQASWRPW